MKITIKQAYEAAQVLPELANASGIPAKTAYIIGRVSRSVQSHVKTAQTAREKVLQNLSEKDEAGNPVFESKKDGMGQEIKSFKLLPEKQVELEKQINELFDQEVEIWGNQISLKDLEKSQIRPIVFEKLEWLITEVIL